MSTIGKGIAPTEKQLLAFWKKYVSGKYLYRIVASRYVSDIQKNGFDPKKNPFKLHENDIKQFCKILLDLHKKGFIMMRWWGKPVDQKTVVETTLRDLTFNYIDFTPESRINYYKELRGGALAQTVHIYAEELLLKRPPLTDKELKLVEKLNVWSENLCRDENKIIVIKASSPYFEHAQFQYFTGENVESPFGSFEHFKKVIKKHSLLFYEPYLKGEQLFYVRTTKKISPSEIVRIY